MKFLPYMTKREREIMCDCLLAVAHRCSPPMRILEWGSGGSTVFFTDLLASHGIGYEWLSLEYNAGWHEKVSAAVEGRPVEVKLFDVGNNDLFQRHTDMDDYVDYPASLGTRYDFILVDGRKRRRCLLEGVSLVTPVGVVALHDAYRKRYHCALEAYGEQDMAVDGTTLWFGVPEGQSL